MEIHGGRNPEKAADAEEVRRTKPVKPAWNSLCNQAELFSKFNVIHLFSKASTILDNRIVIDISGQIEKSTRRMPWHMTPKKDARKR